MRQKHRGRRASLSFVIVLSVLIVGTLGLLYLSGQPVIHHLPSEIPAYTSVWAKYVPSDFYQVAFQNFTLMRAINPSLPPANPLLELINPDLNISTSAATAAASITLTAPNQTVDVAFLTPSAYSLLNSTLSAHNPYNATVGDSSIYFVGQKYNGSIEFGWLGLIPRDHSIALTLGYSKAQDAITKVIRTEAGALTSMLSVPNIGRTFYIGNGTRGHLAVGFQNFPGVVLTGNMTGIFVDSAGDSLRVSNIVGFPPSVSALSQYSYTKSVYSSYTTFTIYDAYIDVQAIRPTSSLQQLVRLVGGA